MLVETVALVTLVAAGTLLFGVRGTITAGILAAFSVFFLSLRLTGPGFSKIDLIKEKYKMYSYQNPVAKPYSTPGHVNGINKFAIAYQ